MSTFLLKAVAREDIGKGASRRLRREDKIPAVIYGADQAPQAVTVSHFDLLRNLNDETFYTQIIDIEVAGEVQETILRDLQRHPYKPKILHADFQRIVRGQELTVRVPIHCLNADAAVGIKNGGVFYQNVVDIEVICRPRDLPTALEIDAGELDINDSLRLTDIPLPEGVRLDLFEGVEEIDEELDEIVVSIHPPRAEEEVEEEVSTDDDAEETVEETVEETEEDDKK